MKRDHTQDPRSSPHEPDPQITTAIRTRQYRRTSAIPYPDICMPQDEERVSGKVNVLAVFYVDGMGDALLDR